MKKIAFVLLVLVLSTSCEKENITDEFEQEKEQFIDKDEVETPDER